jgi:membrane-associated phospholipid phosphatase
MHVAVAMFTVIRLDDVLRRAGAPGYLHLINGVWFVAIAASTLMVKQHVVLDVVAGALLGIAFALPSLRWRPAPPERRRISSAVTDQTPTPRPAHQRTKAR